MTTQPDPEQATGFKVEPTGKANEYTLDVSTGTSTTAVTIDCSGASALAAVLVMRLSRSQTVEAHKALQAFALRSIVAKTTADGIPYVEYALENGLRFASGFTAEEMQALQASIGEVLAKMPKP